MIDVVVPPFEVFTVLLNQASVALSFNLYVPVAYLIAKLDFGLVGMVMSTINFQVAARV
jgi:hypothetical protein